MALLSRQPRLVATALLVPLLSLASPGWLKLNGVPPEWAVLWLLPWALSEGSLAGIGAGLGLGLLLDGLHPDSASLVPGLMLLGWWWGRMGRKALPIQRSFSLGLLALIGTALLNLSLMGQLALQSWWQVAALQPGLQVLLAQTLLTALLAPMLCSLQLLFWRQLEAGGRGSTP